MSNLLNSIRGFFRKKDEEDNIPKATTPTVPTVNLGVGTNNPTQNVTQNSFPQSVTKAVGDFFKPVPDQVRIRDVIREIPSSFMALTSPAKTKEATKDINPVGQFAANRIAAPILQAPYNIKETFGGEDKNIFQRGLHLAAGTLGAVPAIDDAIMALYDYGKGIKKEQLEGVKTLDSYKNAVKYLTGQEYVGAGDALTADPLGRTIGNIAEFPLLLFGGMTASKRRAALEAVKGLEPEILRSVKGIANYDNFSPQMQMDIIDEARKVSDQVIPQIVKSKEMRDLSLRSPGEWMKLVSEFMQDALVEAKDPTPNIGFNVRKIRRLSDAGVELPTEKQTLKSADDVVAAIQKEFNISPQKWSSTEPPAKLRLDEITSTIKNKYGVDDRLLSDTFKNKKVAQGQGYVVQNNNGEVIVNIFDDFKNKLSPTTEVKPKRGVDLQMASPKTGVSLSKKTVPKVVFADPTEYAKTANANRGGLRKLEKIVDPEVEVDPVELESAKRSILAGEKINPVVLDGEGNVVDGATQLKAMRELGVKSSQVVVRKSEVSPNISGQTKSLFRDMDTEADRIMKEELGLLTPKQFDTATERQMKSAYKTSEKLDREATKLLGEDTISLEGRGGVSADPDVLKSIPNLKDKEGPLGTARFNRETPLRNIEDVAGEYAKPYKEIFVDSVTKDTSNVNNFVARSRKEIEQEVVKKLGIKPRSLDDQLTKDYGEGKFGEVGSQEAITQLKQQTDNWENVVEANNYFRQLYDNLLNQINTVVTRFGYDPIPRRKDYYTHSVELGNTFSIFGNIAKLTDDRLPDWLRGLSADFKPGKQFFSFAQPRMLDDSADYTKSAISAVESYLEPAANQIYRTETIQKARNLERVVKDALLQLPEEKQRLPLGNFSQWLSDQTNYIAGKKTYLDRGAEGMFGRNVFKVANEIKNRASANLVGANLSSAMTNTIGVLTQVPAVVNKKSFVKALVDTARQPLTESTGYIIDGVESTFLRNRFPSDKLAKTWSDNARETLGILFEATDKFSAQATVRSFYNDALSKGSSPEQAMRYADEMAAKFLGDRSFGQLPMIFASKALGPWTNFQLEINNQMSVLAKDIPQLAGEDGKKLASMLAQVAIYSWIYNNVFETFTGRRPAFDPIDATLYTVDETYSNDPANQKFQKIATKVGEYTPFVQTFLGGGRIPMLSGIPEIQDLANNPKKALLKFASIYASPVGGGYQAFKTLGGVSDFAQGEATTTDGRIKYTIDQDAPNFVRAILFGSSAFPEAAEYYDQEKSPLGVDDTIILRQLQERDPEKAKLFEQRVEMKREINSELNRISKEKDALKLIIGDPNVSASDKEKAKQRFKENTRQIIEDVKQKLKGEEPGLGSLIENFMESFVGKVYAAEELQPGQTPPPSAVAGGQKNGLSVGTKEPNFINLRAVREAMQKTGGKKVSLKKLSLKPIKISPPTPTKKKRGRAYPGIDLNVPKKTVSSRGVQL